MHLLNNISDKTEWESKERSYTIFLIINFLELQNLSKMNIQDAFEEKCMNKEKKIKINNQTTRYL